MKIRQSNGLAHKWATRVLASGVMLGMYAFGMIATTGLAITAGATPAHAQRGRGRGGGWGGGGAAGAAIGLGLGAAIIGGAIAAQEAEQAAAADAAAADAAAYCARKYRSYDPASGTFMGRDGMRRPCP